MNSEKITTLINMFEYLSMLNSNESKDLENIIYNLLNVKMEDAMNKEYTEAYETLCNEMDRRHPGWNKDKALVKRVQQAARKTVRVSRRCFKLGKKYHQQPFNVRRLFMFVHDWKIVIEELKSCKREKRSIDFAKVAERMEDNV